MEGRVTVETTRFGRIEADEAELIHTPGLPGFPEARRFVVRQHDRGSIFGWLISVDVPDLAFLICDPRRFFPEYAPEIEPRQLRALGAKDAEQVEVMSIASVSSETLALNLCAPVLINPESRRGVQAILDRGGYPTRAEIVLPSPEAAAGPAEKAR